ncbi:unnamed protein product [Gongylonema pulchrum]|uniref:NopRA1 domain-containing protein n=1 Tax=Gongylonema pulchrum TaxID=637853 RepID=A0A183E239_9BILA|nr:unnamed protein product [Gongylonema pulchrum]
MSLRPIFPLVWGERSKDNYEKLHLLGPVLHTRLTPDQVLDYLDPTLMWNTLLQSEQTTALVAHFFARVTKLLLHPEDPVYQPVVSFLLLKPDVDLENVPEMYKLLMSCSTQFHDTERHWCLRLITDSLIEPNDYNILQKRYGIKLFLSLFGSSIADRQTRKYILLSLRAALQHRSVANDLYRRQNLHSWIVLSLQVQFSCLFTTLIKRIKKIWRRNAKNGARESEWRKNITQNTCQILGSKVCYCFEQSMFDSTSGANFPRSRLLDR